jgi:hypothetical protein
VKKEKEEEEDRAQQQVFTSHEAIGVWSGSDASIVWIVEFEWQQVLESVLAEHGRALE